MKIDDKINTDSMMIYLKQPYAITVAQHNFSVAEMRIMARVFEALKPTINELRHKNADGSHMRYYTPAEVGKTNLGDTVIKIAPKYLLPAGSKNHNEIKKALKSLTKRSITIENRNAKGEIYSETYTNVLMSGEFDKYADFVEMKLHEKLVPQLIALARDNLGENLETKDNYTTYSLSTTMRFKSKYSQRIYQYISHFRDKKTSYFSSEALFKYLNLPKSYTDTNIVKKRVLEPVEKDLKNNADTWFEIEKEKKSGKRVIGWFFTIYTKKPPKQKTKPKQLNFEEVTKQQLLEEERALVARQKQINALKIQLKNKDLDAQFVARLVNYFKLAEWQSKKVCDFRNESLDNRTNLDRCLNYIRRKDGIDDLGAYTVHLLKKQLGLDV